VIDLRSRIFRSISINPQSGCWEWQKYRHEQGYGIVAVGGRNMKAHRVVWVLWFGPIPASKVVMHKCDNPCCCNPLHLSIGTQADNVADMLHKGRAHDRRGENGSIAKLTQHAVLSIKQRRSDGERVAVLAAEYGVKPSTIYQVLSGRNWSHLHAADAAKGSK
jgi:hypothetical protein